MTMHYVIGGSNYDYEIEYEDYLKAITHILRANSKEELIEIILNFDECSVDLFKEFKEEIREYFRADAEKQYMEDRYE
jgi:hypothetical protein